MLIGSTMRCAKPAFVPKARAARRCSTALKAKDIGQREALRGACIPKSVPTISVYYNVAKLTAPAASLRRRSMVPGFMPQFDSSLARASKASYPRLHFRELPAEFKQRAGL